MRIFFLAFILIILFQNIAFPQIPNDTVDKERVKKIIISESVVYAAGMTGLGFLWYNGSESQPFQFFNDNKQWQQMDKLGHVYTAYHLTDLNFYLLQSAGIDAKKAMLISSISSATMMLPIEILDGYSTAYGASWGDIVANTIGAFLPYQRFLFNTNYIYPKFSFSPSPYAELRPNTLGSNYLEQVIKDYNGQTYWLSTDFNIFSKSNDFPNWLQFSFGYSANRMLYGNPVENTENGFTANRQWIFSLDINTGKIAVEKKWLKAILHTINMVKIPFPAIEWNGKDVVLHPLYF